MPPVRSTPTPVKPLKTERTHEENQERAYIAASRRGDRSLEARVESARRASEIHKRRTGRSLRVTEQDVLNEEMYEEEDNDLPLQYRRLTSHINTNSPDFNRQLAAFISSRVALQQAVEHVRAQQASMDPRWPKPINTTSQPLAQGLELTSPLAMPQSPRSPGTYRHSPYPMTLGQSARTESASHARRMSAPSTSTVSGIPSFGQSAGSPQSDGTVFSPSGQFGDTMDSQLFSPSITTSHPTRDAPGAYSNNFRDTGPLNDANVSPLATSLSRDTQMFLPLGFNPSDPFNPQPSDNARPEKTSYGIRPNALFGSPTFHTSSDGMSQTLAPSALETINEWPTEQPAKRLRESPKFTPSLSFDFDDVVAETPPKLSIEQESCGEITGSGQATPAELDWSSFINSSPWDESN